MRGMAAYGGSAFRFTLLCMSPLVYFSGPASGVPHREKAMESQTERRGQAPGRVRRTRAAGSCGSLAPRTDGECQAGRGRRRHGAAPSLQAGAAARRRLTAAARRLWATLRYVRESTTPSRSRTQTVMVFVPGELTTDPVGRVHHICDGKVG